MQALVVVDAQNEFSPGGAREVEGHAEFLQGIQFRVAEARAERRPIAWIQHHNRPHESRAFVPGTWGAELSPGLGVAPGYGPERHFTKDVYGAFTRTGLEDWLRSVGATEVLVVGFYTHMCVSTTVREALVRDLDVTVDPSATGARALTHADLGTQTAAEVKRTALLQLENMGARIARLPAGAGRPG